MQAIAALASVGVTIWLARLTAKYVRITEEISRATGESVKQALSLAKLNDEAAGQVLLAEARRIRSELGPSPTDDVPDPFLGNAAVPGIHPWVHGTIPAAARLDPHIVDLFMRLDRLLENHRMHFAAFTDADGEFASPKEWLASDPAPVSTESNLPSLIASESEQTRRLDAARRNVDRLHRLTTLSYRRCHETLDEIAELLAG